jgi:two-component system, cell cycle response regulator
MGFSVDAGGGAGVSVVNEKRIGPWRSCMTKNKKVLVVEDNHLNLKLVRSLLDLNGYTVIEAMDGEAGIAKAKESRPDLILMDIQLPGLDGLKATEILKKDSICGNIPVVALTSYAMQGDEEKAFDAGCSGYITKPIDTRAFIPRIEMILSEKPNKPADPPKAETGAISNKPRILIVDDNPLNIKILKAQLSGEMFEFYTAQSGAECIEKASTLLPDLILLDVMMPELSGYEVTWKLKTAPRTSNIPIILVTALDSPEDKAKGLEVGADEFLTKPVNGIELLTRVRSMLKLKKYYEQLELRTQSEEQFIHVSKTPGNVAEPMEIRKILVVEDDAKDIKLLSNYLSNLPYQLIHTQTGWEALALAKTEKIDLVILDVILPGMDGFEVCRSLKENPDTQNIQVMMLTCLGDLENKLIGVETGTDDFLVKPVNQREFIVRVKALLRKKAYIDQIRFHYEQAMNSSVTDGLTGLYNQAYFSSFLDIEVRRSLRFKHSTVVMMMDVDDFKTYNDTHGHLTGDSILKIVGELLRRNLRDIDLVARYGGDEFAAILPYIDIETAARVAERITKAVSTHSFLSMATKGPLGPVTLSIGLAECPSHAETSQDLIQKADKMLYEAKKAGKNKVIREFRQ